MARAKPQYKRSWKNLLLNKRYQLRFTLFMVGISALLMSGLGIWVMKEANEATTVAMARIRGEACPKIPSIENNGATVEDDGAEIPLKLEDGATPAPAPVKPAEPKPEQPHDPTYLASLWCA